MPSYYPEVNPQAMSAAQMAERRKLLDSLVGSGPENAPGDDSIQQSWDPMSIPFLSGMGAKAGYQGAKKGAEYGFPALQKLLRRQQSSTS